MTTLAELRLANLREQKKSAQEPAAPAQELVPISTVLPLPVIPAPRQEDLVLSQYMTKTQQPSQPEPVADPETEKNIALIARVHSSLSHKTLHPTGAKATVDMSPALFHRAKRYCLDHGNVTLRQLFLDLMTAFLDAEGY